MAVLAPGTPTNTVAGEPTTDFGEHADTTFPLLHLDPAKQMSTAVVLAALTGRVAASALPMIGGDLDYYAPGSLAVQGLWPVLWGRVLRDVVGAGANETALARWAIGNLAVEGPRPAFRVGEQPYGLLPTTAFAAWIDSPGDDLAGVEARIRDWALPWRAGPGGGLHRRPCPRCGRSWPGRRARRRATRLECARVADLFDLRRCARCSACRRSTRAGTTTPHTGLARHCKPIAPIGRCQEKSDSRPAADEGGLRTPAESPTMEPEALSLQRKARSRRSSDARVAYRCARGARRCGRPLAKWDAGAIGQPSRGPTKRHAAARFRHRPGVHRVARRRRRERPCIAERFKEVQEALR